jgi:hypothetical protein
MSLAELNVWREYRARRGFPHERVIHGIANAGAYVGATNRGKARAGDLLARWVQPATPAEREAVKAWFSARAVKPKAGNGG